MAILLLFAFLSGLITIVAPCIWPLLPIILSSSTTGGKRKPLGITVGIMTSFTILTLTISYIVKIIPFDPDILRYIAVCIIGFLGLSLVVPSIAQVLESLVSRVSGKFSTAGKVTGNGFWSGYLTGCSLGIVWTPCAGPILATIATLSATQSVNSSVILVTLAYIVGTGIPLFFFSTIGSRFFSKSRVLSPYTGRIQQVFGVVMILTAIAIGTNYDKVLQANLLDAFPSYSQFVTKLETSGRVKQQLDALKGNPKTNTLQPTMRFPVAGSLPNLGRAPEFAGITKWLNVPDTQQNLTMYSLRGKVVLIDFWTYTCINCIRTLPHVTGWYEKYKDKGFVVVGVHTPEFEFEKKTENVKKAISQFAIHYPVAQDNEFATWNAYSNQYWPAEYLIDTTGTIRRTHFGEGEYEETEKAIQQLLGESGQNANMPVDEKPDETPRSRLSPESYVGSKRMEYYAPDGSVENGKKTFTLPQSIPLNSFSFGGEWAIGSEESIAGNNAVLQYHFTATKVFLVMRPPKSGSGTVKVFLDGKPISKEVAGEDVIDGIITIDTDRLYTLVNTHGNPTEHTVELRFQTEGISAYAFTFG